MKETFLIDGNGSGTILFVPDKGLIMELSEEERKGVDAIIDRPDFSFEKLTTLFPEIDLGRLSTPIDKNDPQAEDDLFCPEGAVLFTTFDCHLCCIYCYSNAGAQKPNTTRETKQKLNMTREIAQIAIDFIINNAKNKGQEECYLGFHGGGEPTKNWSVFQFALEYFRKSTKENGLTPTIALATNGMLSEYQTNWIARRLKAVQVSLDGFKEIHDFQRPTARGSGSFETVSRTVSSLLKKGVGVVIHAVVTELGVGKIPEIVGFLGKNFPGATLHLEPAYSCGRGLTTGQRFPSAEMFVRGFAEAYEIAKSLNTELFYSGAGIQLTDFRRRFCGVYTPNFVITPSGLVTACNEVTDFSHPLAEHFIYGQLDQSKGRFIFDNQKIKRLRDYGLEIDPVCGDCFAQSYCSGDCLVKALNGAGKNSASSLNPRCRINKELTRHFIIHQLTNTRKEEHRE